MKSTESEFYPVAMTIAGSDSSGGAGIQADLRTFASFGVFGCSAITGVTAQNINKVSRVDAIPAKGVEAQIKAVLSTMAVAAIKTGMLVNSEIIEVIAKSLEDKNLSLIVDPVMIATSGTYLLEEDAISVLRERLLPLASWITPNIPEAELLLNKKINTREKIIKAAVELGKSFSSNIILKTGHLDEQNGVAADIVYHDAKLYELSSPYVTDLKASHGTGCTLSSALTAALAMNMPWQKALQKAKAFVYGSLNESVCVGEGVEAMYPPTQSYQGKTLLSIID